MHILLVDDEEQILQVIGDFLADCGYSTTSAGDGAEALKILEGRADIELIVSDIRMPRLDGIQFLRAVRVRFPGIPVILMTGHGDEGVAIAALQEGAQDYLKKPIMFSEFQLCIERVEERARLESQLFEDYRHFLRTGKAAQDRIDLDGAAGQLQALGISGAVNTQKFLVVDGDAVSQKFVRDALAESGYQVQVAGSGEEGLERFAEEMFDVVISEVELPGMDGIEMIQHMRAQDPTMIPIILASGADQETAVRALEGGARSFLVKPFTEKVLKLRMEKALQERKRLVNARLLLGDLIQVRSDLQQKVVERERYLADLIDAAPFGILSTDMQGQILTFNGQAEKMYGYRQDEVVGTPLSGLLGKEAEEELAARPRIDQPASKDYHRCKDGEPLPVLVRHRTILNDKKQGIACLLVVEDLTEREHMESQLVHAERLSLLGQLAPRIAHEFKTPLQLISGHVELALWALEKGDIAEARVSVREVLPAGKQMLDLVHQMLNLGKPMESREQDLDLKVELDKTLDILSHLGVIKYCQITKDFDDSLPRIYGDPAQIEQVFRNLIVNVAQAMEETKQRELGLSLSTSADGRRVEAKVSDSGPGIAPEDLEQIFRPFFTTKPEGKGTGLGLPIVRTILDRHGASIEMESEVDRGTCFTLKFPVFSELGADGDKESAGALDLGN